jgi:sugar lactone lactonase YvrE
MPLHLRGACRAFLLAALISTSAFAQSIVTFAGGGTTDGQAATNIQTREPFGIAFDRAGNVYVALKDAGRVIRVDAATGIATTVAGNGASGFTGDGFAAASATLNKPYGIALDESDNLYIADFTNNRVRKVDAKTGRISTFAGGGMPATGIGDGGPATEAILGLPVGVTISRGFLYITESAFDSHRVRRVELSSGIITTVAGKTDGSEAGFSGDGGRAIDAVLNTPFGIVGDAAGNIFFADAGNSRVRRIDTNGIITTYAGGGSVEGRAADGSAATSARFTGEVTALALDAAGNLLIAANPDIRRVDRASGIISTVASDRALIFGFVVERNGSILFSSNSQQAVLRFRAGETDDERFAGGGMFIGDGRPATAAVLSVPEGLALDAAGNLFIADSGNNVVRRVAAGSRIITTVAGIVGSVYVNESQEGKKATEAVIGFPRDVALDAAGNLYISDSLNYRVWRVATDGTIRSFAGGGEPADRVGDGGAATSAYVDPIGIGLDRSGNLYIADSNAFSTPSRHRIRRVDAQSGTITTIAGGANSGDSGDGGQATQALLNTPTDVAVDDSGNIFIADKLNGEIRRINPAGVISRYAGLASRREDDPLGDNGPAADARLTPDSLEISRTTGALFVSDSSSHRVRRIDAQTTTITTVAGSGFRNLDADFAGDNGAATAAKLNLNGQSGLAIAANGDLYIADGANNRVRTVFACGTVDAPTLTNPGDGASVSTAPELRWNAATRAVRYDVLLDTVSPPAAIVGTDVSGTSFATSNLRPATTYFWRVTAKGDPFCPPSSASSSVRSFTTAGVCTASPFALVGPPDGGSVSGTTTLSWQPSAGAASYDVYLGSTSPPPLFANTTSTSLTTTLQTGRYFWFVVARAACDNNVTSSTAVRSFDVAGAACTPGQLRVTTAAPPDNASGIDTNTTLTWTSTGGATSFDVYFGTAADPPLLSANLTSLQQEVSALTPGTTYFWRVVAKGPCDAAGVTSATARFTTRACNTPGRVTIVFAPAAVSAGSTYTIVWSSAAGLDADGGYLVERATNSDFTADLQSQAVSTTAASFDAEIPGTYFHRVRAVSGCDPTRGGEPSAVRTVTMTPARANVVMTVQPQAEISALGERLADHRGSFALENLTEAPLQVIIGRQELAGSPPFFTVFDPLGGDSAFVTLDPHVPRMFEIRYAGPSEDVPGSYQGVIFLASTGEGLAVTPYAFVNLKVGGATAAAPEISVGGTVVEYAAFPPFAGDDTNRPPLTITIRNNGTVPMDLGAEIGPEVWLVIEPGWNSSPLAPGASRSVNLFTRRSRAPNGSALPRYTYLTLRTKDGASTRLLVQDNDDVSVASARTIRLGPADRSTIVPEVVSRNSDTGATVSTIRLSNVGSDRVQAELLFTPSGVDGFDGSVRRAIVVVPPNDVVTLTDPIVQVFRLARPQAGQVEIRIPRERQGLINVTASIGTPGRGAASAVPTVNRGDGARPGLDHVVTGVRSDATAKTALTLVETTGTDSSTVRLTLVRPDGSVGGTTVVDVSRYGYRRFDDIVATLSGSNVDGARIQITTERGAGAIAAVAFVGNAANVSTPSTTTRTIGALVSRQTHGAGTSLATVVPVVTKASSSRTTRTAVGFVAPAGAATTFNAIFRGATAATTVSRQIAVPANGTVTIRNVAEFFGLPAGTEGSVIVDTPSGSKVHATLESSSGSGSSNNPSAFLPLQTSLSEALTSAGSFAQRPLFHDGLEQSTEASRGTTWSLLLNEVSGASGSVTVRLYEAGNRSVPIAKKDFTVGAYQQLNMDRVFAEMGLELANRRKDRTNVQIAVTARSGGAKIAATVLSTDNVTGDVKAYALMPSVGTGVPNISLVSPVLTGPPPVNPDRRRAVRR